MRRFLSLAVLAVLVAMGACDEASEAELHERVVCSDRWEADVQPFTRGQTTCDAPCADQLRVQQDDVGTCYIDLAGQSNPLLPGRSEGEQLCTSGYDTEWGGVRGCCVPDHPDAPVTFVRCKDE